MKWWRRRNGHDSAKMKEHAEKQAKTTQKLTPLIKQLAAENLAELSEDEFAARVRAAFRRTA